MSASQPDPTAERVVHTIVAFNDALNAHDVDAMMRYMTEDCAFEDTFPPPDGTRHVGQAAVRGYWEAFFDEGQGQHIEIEEIWTAGDRCAMRWVYSWDEADGTRGHVRGVDIYRVRAERIAEKLSYVKG